MKLFWFDTETTGLENTDNDIITLAGMFDIDGEIVEEVEYKMKPLKPENITQEALDVNGFTKSEILTFPDPIETKRDLEKKIKKYINPFKKNKGIDDKFVPAGQNTQFDTGFLKALWTNCGDKWYGSLFSYQEVDLLSVTQILRLLKHLDTPNLKLETMANHFDVKIVAHDAKSDIQATREIFYKILNRFTYK